MIAKTYLKEIKQFFRKSFNVLFMLVAPIVLILLMGYAMSNIVGGTNEIASETDSTVLYIVEKGSSSEYQQKFTEFKGYIENEMDIPFKEAENFDDGCHKVDKQDAIALIKVSADGFYYYRSPYNELTESKILRTAYNTLLVSSEYFSNDSYIETKEIQQKTIDSYTYFTFAELGFIMIYLSIIVGQSVFSEKEIKTFERIYISKANISKMLISKIALGTTVGAIQTVLVYFLSSFILNVNWGNLTILIFVLYILLAVFSSTLGAVLGLYTKKKAALNDRVLIISILFGFLGGGLTPLSFLDNVKVMSILCKISPLYWTTNSAIVLSSGKINEYFVIAITVCLLMIIFMAAIYLASKSKEKVKGVYVYE